MIDFNIRIQPNGTRFVSIATGGRAVEFWRNCTATEAPHSPPRQVEMSSDDAAAFSDLAKADGVRVIWY